MLERVVVRDQFEQIIYEDVIDVHSESDLDVIYSIAYNHGCSVHRYSMREDG